MKLKQIFKTQSDFYETQLLVFKASQSLNDIAFFSYYFKLLEYDEDSISKRKNAIKASLVYSPTIESKVEKAADGKIYYLIKITFLKQELINEEDYPSKLEEFLKDFFSASVLNNESTIKQALDKLYSKAKKSLQEFKKSPFGIAQLSYLKYRLKHPSNPDSVIKSLSLRRISAKKILNFKNKLYKSKYMIIKSNPKSLIDLSKIFSVPSKFKISSKKSEKIEKIVDFNKLYPFVKEEITFDIPQAFIAYHYTLDDKTLYDSLTDEEKKIPLLLITSLFSYIVNKILHLEIRENRGLVYGIRYQSIGSDEAVIHTMTAPNNISKIDDIVESLPTLLESKLPELLSQVKKDILAYFPIVKNEDNYFELLSREISSLFHDDTLSNKTEIKKRLSSLTESLIYKTFTNYIKQYKIIVGPNYDSKNWTSQI